MLAIIPDTSALAVLPRTVTPVLPPAYRRQEQLFSGYANHASQFQRMSRTIDTFVQTIVLQNMGPSASVFVPDLSLQVFFTDCRTCNPA